jgi:hypothetical protein
MCEFNYYNRRHFAVVMSECNYYGFLLLLLLLLLLTTTTIIVKVLSKCNLFLICCRVLWHLHQNVTLLHCPPHQSRAFSRRGFTSSLLQLSST